MANPNASITPPRPVLLPVRSRASHPRATAWPITPKITAAALMNSRRYPADCITDDTGGHVTTAECGDVSPLARRGRARE